MNVSEKVVEKSVNEQNGNKSMKKNMDTIVKLVAQKVEALNIDLSEVSELVELVRNISDLNIKIQKLSEERLYKLNRAREIYEKINGEAKTLLEFLGLINVEEIEKTIGIKTQIAKTQTVKTTTRAERGNGLTDKKIVFDGKMYNMATYFCRKHGITGGLKGLEEWAKSQGRSVKIENDVIYIV